MKYENQKKNLDEINKEKNNENQIKSKNTEEKSKNAFNLIFQNENDYYNYKTNQLKLKQITVKENKKRMTEEICERNKEQDMIYNQKEKDISNLFINKELKIIKKGEDFKKKYNNLLLRKKELDNLNKQNIKLRNFQLKEKENKCKEVRLKEEREKELFRKKLLEKIYESQNNMTKKREKNHLDLKEKFSDLHLKMEDISENLKIREKLIEIKKIKHFEKMEEKNKKVEKMKYAKLQFQNHRKEVSKNLEKDKEKLMNKYYLLKLNRNRSKDDILKELFPEDYKDGSITFEKAKQKLLTNYSDFTMKKGLLSKLLLALICLAGGSMTALAQTPEPSAKWTFDDTADLMAVQTGAFQMTPISVPISGGGVVASTLGGVGISSVSGPSDDSKAIYVPQGAGLKIARPEGSEATQSYTLMMDIMLPDATNWNSLLQTEEANTTDGDLFTHNSQIGIASIGGYFGNIKANKWYRIVLSYRNGKNILYVDGGILAYIGKQP